MVKFTRRGFMIGGAVVGGVMATGMVVGVGYLSTVDVDGMAPSTGPDGQIDLNAWIHIKTDGTIELAFPISEMGQGIQTGLAMLIAEEMELDLTAPNISVVHPKERLSVYTNFTAVLNERPENLTGPLAWLGKRVLALIPVIITGGSTAIVNNWFILRQAGASAREMLIGAAAEEWGVPRGECRAEMSRVVHSSGKSLTFAELAPRAAQQTPPENPVLKSPEDWRIIGKSHPRVDIPAKTRGEARFGIDVSTTDMVYAAVRQCPVFGGSVKSFKADAAEKMPGVLKVVDLDTAIGVIGENTWAAKQGAEAVEIVWDEAGNGALSSAKISKRMHAALAGENGHDARDDGDVTLLQEGTMFEAVYETPYLAHACMEPMNCTAIVRGKTAEFWSPSQAPLTMVSAARAHTDTDETITNTTFLGGGFGRRSEGDSAGHAAMLAAALPGKTVKVIWSREEDIQHDMYRPAAVCRMRAALDKDKKPYTFDFKTATQSVMLSYTGRNLPLSQGGDADDLNTEGARGLPYAIPNIRVNSVHVETPVPVGFWRSVGHSNNAFFVESFIDELANEANADPMAFRRELLKNHPRFAPLAAKLEDVSGWSKPLGPSRARGVSLHESFRSYVGQVAEITLGEDNQIRVDKVICVVDCGQVVNPDSVIAQMESGIIFALSALMFGDILIENGRVVNSNFHDYDMVRMAEAPEIEVHIMQNREPPGGVGEPGTPPLFAAVTNAIFAASGQRIRSLPLAKHGYRFA